MSGSTYAGRPSLGPLFDDQLPSRSKFTDPSTSREAEDQMRKTGRLPAQAEEVLLMLQSWWQCYGEAVTSAELAKEFAADRYMIARRLPDLKQVEPNLVKQCERRQCRVGKAPAITWQPTDMGEIAAAQLRMKQRRN